MRVAWGKCYASEPFSQRRKTLLLRIRHSGKTDNFSLQCTRDYAVLLGMRRCFMRTSEKIYTNSRGTLAGAPFSTRIASSSPTSLPRVSARSASPPTGEPRRTGRAHPALHASVKLICGVGPNVLAAVFYVPCTRRLARLAGGGWHGRLPQGTGDEGTPGVIARACGCCASAARLARFREVIWLFAFPFCGDGMGTAVRRRRETALVETGRREWRTEYVVACFHTSRACRGGGCGGTGRDHSREGRDGLC